ncbi:MAG: hypothetical protein QQN41_08870 [Nitrosopumilus sp.]
MFKMGIGVAALKIFEKLFKEGFFNKINSVMEIGAQEISRINDIPFIESIKKEKLTNLEGKSAKIIYELLGVKEYECIDSDGKFGAHIFDLNKEIDKVYGYKIQFDLVTNYGTSEHIFNQYTCFKNIHNLTKAGGYMIHAVPFRVHDNHCFYMYQYNFLENLAKDNNYEIKGAWISVGVDESVFPVLDIEKYVGEKKVLIFCLLKKTSSNPFKIPFQDEYKEASKLR